MSLVLLITPSGVHKFVTIFFRWADLCTGCFT